MEKNHVVKELNEVMRESIQISVLHLLKDNSIDKISITEICNKAGVSRNSFYRNYETKEMVILDYLEKTAADFSEIASSSDIHEYYYDLFNHLYNHKDILLLLKKRNLLNLLYEVYIKYSKFTTIFQGRDEYTERYMVGGAFFVMLKWLENSMDKSPEEIADILTRFINNKYIP